MTRPLAPALRAFVETFSCGQRVCQGDCQCHLVADELRAVLAVARAARRHRLSIPHAPGDHRVGDERRCPACEMHRALKALDRATRRST